MLSRRGFIAGTAAIFLLGRRWQPATAQAVTPITVYKSKSCGCCTKWVDHLKANGFNPQVHDEEEMDRLKDEIGVPSTIRSCHTALIGKYLIEGHVPASDIRRLLAEGPKVAGLAVPGMPAGTPGMAEPGSPGGDYEVLSFQADGSTSLFARH